MKKKLLPTIVTATLAFSSNLYGGEKAADIQITPPADSWEFGIAPYLWLAGIEGTTAISGLPAASVDADFNDIWDNLDFAGFLALEANKGRFKSFVDFQYIKLGADASVAGAADFNLGVEQVRLELGMGYEVYSSDTTSVIAYGAVMYNYLDNSISGPKGVDRSSSESWVDPAVGIKLQHALNDKWHVNLTGEYGGFGVTSDTTWQALGALGYTINDKWALLGGYRHQSIDYSKGDFVYDMDTSGPFLGAKYSF